MNLTDKLATLPDKPGVYLFKNRSGKIIYVGKAKSLRHRVRSYFTEGDDGRILYPLLIAAIRDFDIILTRDEVEALTAEANLIKLHRPRYNIDLKDDKSFPFIQITREAFPRIFLTRKKHEKKSDYYGPYTDVRTTRYLIRTLCGILQIRTCSLQMTPEKVAAGKFKICLDYHIGRCGAPCVGVVSEVEYKRGADRFIKFLKGQHEDIMHEFKTEMDQLAKVLRFEEAAVMRDRLRAATRFSQRQLKVDSKPVNRDAVGFAREDSYAAFSVIKVRNGRIVGQSPFHLERVFGHGDDALIEAFTVRHYDLADSLPDEIFLSTEPPSLEVLTSHLSRLAGKKVHITIPRRGDKRKLVETAEVNAEYLLLERRVMSEKRDFIPRAAKALQEHLKLPEPPMLIEAFDVSNLFGTDSVASMVTFRDGKPLKSGYRLYKINSVDGIDDFASIKEAVKRRYTRLKEEISIYQQSVKGGDEADSRHRPRFPDLILVDGGKGQLSAAKAVLNGLGMPDQPVIGLAKRLEEVFLPGFPEPQTLPRASSALRLLQQVRDEAHRFAVKQHRLMRGKRQIRSRLDDIPGIGSNRRQALLKKFGSVKRIAKAGVDEIASVHGISRQLAEIVKKELT